MARLRCGECLTWNSSSAVSGITTIALARPYAAARSSSPRLSPGAANGLAWRCPKVERSQNRLGASGRWCADINAAQLF
jgi:hypothetical protein